MLDDEAQKFFDVYNRRMYNHAQGKRVREAIKHSAVEPELATKLTLELVNMAVWGTEATQFVYDERGLYRMMIGLN